MGGKADITKLSPVARERRLPDIVQARMDARHWRIIELVTATADELEEDIRKLEAEATAPVTSHCAVAKAELKESKRGPRHRTPQMARMGGKLTFRFRSFHYRQYARSPSPGQFSLAANILGDRKLRRAERADPSS